MKGYQICLISTHRGQLNEFNQIVEEIKTGARKGSLHTIPLKLAIEEGVYRKVCKRAKIEWTEEGQREWEEEVRADYIGQEGNELDYQPSADGGQFFTSEMVRSCMELGKIVLWNLPDDFAKRSPDKQLEALKEWQMYDPTQKIIADYVLRLWQMPLAILEAKAEDKPAADGMQQGSRYAQRLGLRFSIASNGSDYILTDNETGAYERLTKVSTPRDILNRLGLAALTGMRGDPCLSIPGTRIRLRDGGCARIRRWRSPKHSSASAREFHVPCC